MEVLDRMPVAAGRSSGAPPRQLPTELGTTTSATSRVTVFGGASPSGSSSTKASRVVMAAGGWSSFQAIELYLNAPTETVGNEAFDDAGLS